MNISLPATTDKIIGANPRVFPDAVLAELYRQHIAGHVYRRGEIWYAVKRPVDRDFQPLAKRQRRVVNCAYCQAEFKQRGTKQKYCGVTCAHNGKIIVTDGERRKCLRCGIAKAMLSFPKSRGEQRNGRCHSCLYKMKKIREAAGLVAA